MVNNKSLLKVIILISVLIGSRNIYEMYRLFLIFLPTYIFITYLTVNVCFDKYVIIRFTSIREWRKSVIECLMENITVASIILCIDKLYIIKHVNIELGPAFLQYFLFLSIFSLILIFPFSNILKTLSVSTIFMIIQKTGIIRLSIFNSLYDLTSLTINGGIIYSIIALVFVFTSIFLIYLLTVSKESLYEYN